MLFCPSLVRDVNFEPDAIQPCCNIRSIRVPRFPFAGGGLSLPAYTRHIHAMCALLREGSICQGCPELKELPEGVAAPDLNILFHTVSFNMHRWLCNCKCVYCNFHKQRKETYSILPAIESLYSQDIVHEDCYFSWGGGESTLLREFDEAATLIYQYGAQQYIHTNALRYSAAIAMLLAKGRAGVNISLDSGSRDVYAMVKGVDSFERVTAHIGKYISAAKNKYDITIKYILFSANNSQREIENFFVLCKTIGIVNVEFSFDFREVNARTLSSETLDSAILFIGLAHALNIRCSPFFVDPSVIVMLEERASFEGNAQ